MGDFKPKVVRKKTTGIAGKKTDIPVLAGGPGVASWDRIILTFVILLSFLLIAGCASQAREVTASVGEEFSIAIGQRASIAGEELKIKFIEVVADSRCPTGATCVWQGEVTCLVEISYLESLCRKALTQPGLTVEPSQTEFKDYEIIFNVKPYPVVGKEIENTDYRLQLTVNKKSALSGGVLVTFDVVGERYSVFISNNNTIEQVFALQRGESEAAIPSGRPALPKFADFVKLITIDIYDKRSDKLLEQLRNKAQMLGNGTVALHELHAGFARFRARWG